jgi:tetratricopeptide (TPR) repeat protein
LFTLVRLGEWQHSVIIMSVILMIVFSALFAIGQTPWEGLSKLARQRQNADDLAGAESLRREALQLAEKQLGPADKQLAPMLADLAFVLHFEARDAEAEPLMQRAYLIAKESGDDRLTGSMLNVLGVVLSGEGQKARAEPVLRRSVALLDSFETTDGLNTARADNNLATLYLDTHQYAKAEEEMTRALPIYERNLGPDDPELALVLGNMFTVLAAQHRSDEGEPYLQRALVIGRKAFPGSLKMANLEVCLAALKAQHEEFKEAAVLLKGVIATQERLLGPEHPEVAHSLTAYATVLHHMHQKTEAKNALNRANMILKSALNDVK